MSYPHQRLDARPQAISRRTGCAVRVDPDLLKRKQAPAIRGNLTSENLIRRSIGGSGLYKAEVIHRRGPWRSFEAIEYATLECVDSFNHRRLLEPIRNIPPAEAEDQCYAAADNIDMAA